MKIGSLVLVLAAPLAAEETFYYVDSVNGVDVATGGSIEQPWKSITYALSQPLDTLARINLFPGEYNSTTGEVFPIDVPPQTSLVGVVECGARIVSSPGLLAPALRWNVGCCDGGYSILSNVAVTSDDTAVRVIVGADATFGFEMTGVRILGLNGVRFDVNPGARLDATVNDTTMDVGFVPVFAVASPGSASFDTHIDLDINRSQLEWVQSFSGVEAYAFGPGSSVTVGGNSSILAGGFAAGVHLHAADGGLASASVEHFVFTDLREGGVLATATGGSPAPTFFIQNSIFWDNFAQQDLQQYDPATYTLVTNLFEDPALVGIGASIAGPPDFIGPGTSDWRILPSSPARDAGTTSPDFDAVDFDGDPRMVIHGGDGVPDIGVDEFFDRYVYFATLPSIGQSANLRVLGIPGDSFAVFLGPISYFPGFGSGLQLQSVYFPTPLLQGTITASGLSEGPVPVPFDPALLGFPFMAQAVYIGAGGLSFSSNAFKGWICR